jgi:PAS domain S-box-containing protein
VPKNFNRRIGELAEDTKTMVILLVLFGSISCLIYSYFTPAGLAGSQNYIMANFYEAMIGFVIMGALFFAKKEKTVKILVFIYITQLDLINIYIIYATDFQVSYYYQFIVFYILCTWFFDRYLPFYSNMLISLLGVVVLCLYTDTLFTQTEFYLTFFVTVFFLFPLMLRKISKELRIQSSEAKYRLLAENSADIICTHKRGGDFIFVSPSCYNLIGYKPEEMTNKKPYFLLHPDDIELFKEKFFDDFNEEMYNKPLQYRVKHKNGQYVWFETVVKVLEKGSGQKRVPEVFLSQSRNFQSHKEFEQKIVEKNIQLEKSYKEMEMFAYITSHDMQEPLRMITNYLQLVKSRLKNIGDNSLNDFIDYAFSGAQNLQVLIKDILAYSTTNKIVKQNAPISMDRLFVEVNSDLHMLFEEKEATLIFPDNPLPLKAEKNAMRLVFQNLILNGIKYNKKPNPIIEVNCWKENGAIIYSFEDNGIGIEKRFWSQIFEPFQRLHTKKEYSGTGLGLPICKKIIEKHGGEIWLDSTLGKGSTFYIRIPD